MTEFSYLNRPLLAYVLAELIVEAMRSDRFLFDMFVFKLNTYIAWLDPSGLSKEIQQIKFTGFIGFRK